MIVIKYKIVDWSIVEEWYESFDLVPGTFEMCEPLSADVEYAWVVEVHPCHVFDNKKVVSVWCTSVKVVVHGANA